MSTPSKPGIVISGAGFGGLGLTTLLSEALGDIIHMTPIDEKATHSYCDWQGRTLSWRR